MFRSRIVGPLLLVAFVIFALRPPVAPAAATLIPIPISNGRPTALGVYQAADKLIVANTQDASLMIFDGATRSLLATLPAGRNIYDGALIVDETYGRAYAASRDGDQGSGAGTGAIYVVNMASNALHTTIPKRVTSGNSLALAHDPVRHRVYVADAGRLSWINVATNAVTAVAPPAETGELFFRPSEMAVNAATNDVFLAQDTYGYHRLWILDADTWTWSSIDFAAADARYPAHVAVSEAENKVFVKLVTVPGQPEPGIYVLDRDTGISAYIGNDDYGRFAFNSLSGRLFTGIEVGESSAVVEASTNTLHSVPLPALAGAANAIAVRPATDHAFLADQSAVVILDGASRTHLALPVANTPQGGLLAQDVAVNDATGWAYVIADNNYPFVLAVQDLPPGPVNGDLVTPTPTASSTSTGPAPSATPSATVAPSAGSTGYLPLMLRQAPPTATPTATTTPTPPPTSTPTATTAPGLPQPGHWTGLTSRSQPVSFDVDPGGATWREFKLKIDFSVQACGGTVAGTTEVSVAGPGAIAGGEMSYDGATFDFGGSFGSATSADGYYSFTNHRIVAGVPYPPFTCTFYLTTSGTWSAMP